MTKSAIDLAREALRPLADRFVDLESGDAHFEGQLVRMYVHPSAIVAAGEALAALTVEPSPVPPDREQVIRYSPAECYADCEDPNCPYMHSETWSIGDQVFHSEAEAKAATKQSSVPPDREQVAKELANWLEPHSVDRVPSKLEAHIRRAVALLRQRAPADVPHGITGLIADIRTKGGLITCPDMLDFLNIVERALDRRQPDPAEVEAWAVVDASGRINVRTISDTRRAAIINWLVVVKHVRILASFSDEVVEERWMAHKGSASVETIGVGRRLALPAPAEIEAMAKRLQSLVGSRIFDAEAAKIVHEIVALIRRLALPAVSWRPTHRHYKGGLYREIARGRIEADRSPVVVYDNEKGETWVRPVDNFDARIGMNHIPRFEMLPAVGDPPTQEYDHGMRFGPSYEKPCNNPLVIECSYSKCQALGHCRLPAPPIPEEPGR